MSQTQIVYLAGPISHMTYEEAQEWRESARVQLEGTYRDRAPMYKTLNPLRGKEYLAKVGTLEAVDVHGQGWGGTIVPRDHYDVSRCDILLLNLSEADKVSIGSMFELCWASTYRKFSIVVMEHGNIHEHEFVKSHASLVVPTLEEAYTFLLEVLN